MDCKLNLHYLRFVDLFFAKRREPVRRGASRRASHASTSCFKKLELRAWPSERASKRASTTRRWITKRRYNDRDCEESFDKVKLSVHDISRSYLFSLAWKRFVILRRTASFLLHFFFFFPLSLSSFFSFLFSSFSFFVFAKTYSR